MITVKNCSLSYGKRPALKEISLSAEPGELTVLIGPNGSGKTSLLRGLSGRTPFDPGEVFLEGEPVVFDEEWAERVSFVPASGGVLPVLTVEEQLFLHCRLSGADPDEAADRTGRLLALLNLESHRGYRGNELSTGLEKRLQIGLGIARDVACYLIDEPFTGLDAENVGTLQEILRILAERGKYVFIASHAVAYLRRLTFTLWELKNGREAVRYVGDAAAEKIEKIAGERSGRPDAGDLPWIR